MNPLDLSITEKRKALELFDLILDGNVKYSHNLSDEQVEEIFKELEKYDIPNATTQKRY